MCIVRMRIKALNHRYKHAVHMKTVFLYPNNTGKHGAATKWRVASYAAPDCCCYRCRYFITMHINLPSTLSQLRCHCLSLPVCLPARMFEMIKFFFFLLGLRTVNGCYQIGGGGGGGGGGGDGESLNEWLNVILGKSSYYMPARLYFISFSYFNTWLAALLAKSCSAFSHALTQILPYRLLHSLHLRLWVQSKPLQSSSQRRQPERCSAFMPSEVMESRKP